MLLQKKPFSYLSCTQIFSVFLIQINIIRSNSSQHIYFIFKVYYAIFWSISTTMITNLMTKSMFLFLHLVILAAFIKVFLFVCCSCWTWKQMFSCIFFSILFSLPLQLRFNFFWVTFILYYIVHDKTYY